MDQNLGCRQILEQFQCLEHGSIVLKKAVQLQDQGRDGQNKFCSQNTFKPNPWQTMMDFNTKIHLNPLNNFRDEREIWQLQNAFFFTLRVPNT
jgi:hypothetical protein